MQASKHNIISKITDSDDYYIVNLLSGQADILEPEMATALLNGQPTDTPLFIEKGYWVDPAEEAKLYRKKYVDFLDNRDTNEVQLFFVPNYSCNFSCSYCFQDEYTNPISPMSHTVTDAFFAYVTLEFAGRKKYITVFGGEPLLPGDSHRDQLDYFLKQAKANQVDIAVVTNGYLLEEYIPILKQATIREVQVTLDGMAEAHNKRRYKKGGQGTFDIIVQGVDAALQAGIPINMRMVIDKENIEELPKLARFAIDRGWTESPLFKTQLGRNYELHHCQSENQRLFTRLGMYEQIYSMLKVHPEIEQFHRPAFSVAKFLWEQGELPEPLFDACPATKTEWAFDYTGSVYSCTATVGKADEKLGTYYPTVTRKQEAIENWEDRDVLAIDKCKDCALQLACGGGCGSVAKNQHGGNVLSPDCRPIEGLLELGISHYFCGQAIED